MNVKDRIKQYKSEHPDEFVFWCMAAGTAAVVTTITALSVKFSNYTEEPEPPAAIEYLPTGQILFRLIDGRAFVFSPDVD